MTGRRFMDGASFWERQAFVSLGQAATVVAPPVVVAAPETAVAPAPASDSSKITTVLVTAGVLFFAAEVVGLTHFLGMRK